MCGRKSGTIPIPIPDGDIFIYEVINNVTEFSVRAFLFVYEVDNFFYTQIIFHSFLTRRRGRQDHKSVNTTIGLFYTHK